MEGAAYYKIEAGMSPSFSGANAVAWNDTTANPFYTRPHFDEMAQNYPDYQQWYWRVTPYEPYGTYYWRVRTLTATSQSGWSNIWRFQVAASSRWHPIRTLGAMENRWQIGAATRLTT